VHTYYNGSVVQRDQPFSIRIGKAELEAYKRAAEEAGMSVSEWARHVLDVSSGARRIRHVYFIDVGSMEPEDAIKKLTPFKSETGDDGL
jgi:hypothetical protein